MSYKAGVTGPAALTGEYRTAALELLKSIHLEITSAFPPLDTSIWTLQSGCRNPPGQSSFVKPFQTVTPAKTPDIIYRINYRIDGLRCLLANSDECLHGFHPLLAPAQVAFADRFPHEFRNGGLSAAGASVKGAPEVVVKIKLGSPHDVYSSSYRITACRSRSNCLRAISAHCPELSSFK